MLLGNQTLDTLANYFTREDERCANLLLMEHSFSTLAHPRDITHTSKPCTPSLLPLLILYAATERKRKRNDDYDSSDTAPVAHTSKLRSYPYLPNFLIHSGNTDRTLKVIFVEDGSRKEIGGPGMAVILPGTLLNDAKNIISSAFAARNPSMQERAVIGIEWEGVSIIHDAELEGVQHRDTVVAVIQGMQNNE